MLQSVLCITTNKYLVVLLHARFSVVGPIPFLLAAIFPQVIGSTTVLPNKGKVMQFLNQKPCPIHLTQTVARAASTVRVKEVCPRVEYIATETCNKNYTYTCILSMHANCC